MENHLISRNEGETWTFRNVTRTVETEKGSRNGWIVNRRKGIFCQAVFACKSTGV